MSVWLILLIVIYVLVDLMYIITYIKEGGSLLWTLCLLVIWPVLVVYDLLVAGYENIKGFFDNVKKHGGWKGYMEWRKEEARKRAQWKEEEKETERLKEAFKKGELTRQELPRETDGIRTFEFDNELGLFVYPLEYPKVLFYVENKYNDVLNAFFKKHPDIQFSKRCKFVYLPGFGRNLADDVDFLYYHYPHYDINDHLHLALDSSYPLRFLSYLEDAENIRHGLMLFEYGYSKYGFKEIKGSFYPLEEGTDEQLIEQLKNITSRFDKIVNGVVYSIAEKPKLEEGVDENYADEWNHWIVDDNKVAVIVDEIRERIEALKKRGLDERFLLSLLKEEPKLSRLVVTKDFRIILPDYHDMEIKMEPLNKAVYLLFLRHPEGIVFKCLPDYREELTEIYRQIRPNGLNEKALKSIENVTNPTLNSINEKCARIRGYFISEFSESIAREYYIFGFRGHPKMISLSRKLVEWESNDDEKSNRR